VVQSRLPNEDSVQRVAFDAALPAVLTVLSCSIPAQVVVLPAVHVQDPAPTLKIIPLLLFPPNHCCSHSISNEEDQMMGGVSLAEHIANTRKEAI
jgi:hypothetical protein